MTSEIENHSQRGDKRCAYCRGSGPFTREHVIPKFIYKRFPKHDFGYHHKADRYIRSEGTIRDVCSECNSGPLSKLDLYGQQFFSKNRCNRQFVSPQWVKVQYNYNQLLRWILKIHYNNKRTVDRETKFVEGCIPFILKGENLPYNSYIFIEVIRSYKLTSADREYLPKKLRDANRGRKYLPPHAYVLSKLSFAGITDEQLLAWLFGIRAFHFYVLLFRLGCPSEICNELLSDFRKKIRHARQLRPDQKLISIRTSTRTFFDVHIPGERTIEAYERYKSQGWPDLEL